MYAYTVHSTQIYILEYATGRYGDYTDKITTSAVLYKLVGDTADCRKGGNKKKRENISQEMKNMYIYIGVHIHMGTHYPFL